MLNDIVAYYHIEISIRNLCTNIIICSTQNLNMLLASLFSGFTNRLYAPIFNLFGEIQPKSSSRAPDLSYLIGGFRYNIVDFGALILIVTIILFHLMILYHILGYFVI